MEPVSSVLHLEVEDSEGKVVEKIITIDPDDFSIDEANLDGELCRAGTLLCYYGDLVAELEAKSANIKNLAEEIRSQQAISLRQAAEQSGKKLTEGALVELINGSPGRSALLFKLVQAQKESMKAVNLFKAQFQKVECLKALSYRQRRMEGAV